MSTTTPSHRKVPAPQAIGGRHENPPQTEQTAKKKRGLGQEAKPDNAPSDT